MSGLADFRATYVVEPGVYSGKVVLCRCCKGITYFSPEVFLHDTMAEWMAVHSLWCPAVIDEALKLLH